MKLKQSGQATIEFIVACLVMIPLFFGIYYFARYSDIKQAAIQASRYAAFERTWDPSSRIKSDQVISDEMRARFFVNQNKINYRDTPAKNATKDIDLWVQVDQKKLINNISDVSLNFDSSTRFNAGVIINKLDSFGGTVFNLPTGHIIKAQIDVPLTNIVHFKALSDINIKLPAAVAIGSGTWNASGSNNGDSSVCNRAGRAVPTHLVPSAVNSIIGIAMAPFEATSPQFGIMLPDYVPPGSLRKNNSATATNTPLNEQAWNPCNSSHKQPS